jgi:hypothetical protein
MATKKPVLPPIPEETPSESQEVLIPTSPGLLDLEKLAFVKIKGMLATAAEDAREAIEQDIRALLDGEKSRHEKALRVGWDVLQMTVTNPDSKVSEVLAKMRAEYEKKGREFPSDAALYRATGPLQRVIQKRARLGRPLTKPYLQQNPHLLLLVGREELKKLAADYPTQQKFNAEFPSGRQPNEEIDPEGIGPVSIPECSVETLSRQADEVLKTQFVLIKLLELAPQQNMSLPPELGATMKQIEKMSGRLHRAARQIQKPAMKKAESRQLQLASAA